MAYIYVELNEIYDDLGKSEKKELVEWLKNDGFIEEKRKGVPIPSYKDDDFNEALVSMVGKRHMLTVEEEVVIMNMAKRFAYEHTGK